MGTVRLLRRLVPAAAPLLLILLGAVPGAAFAQDAQGGKGAAVSPWEVLDGARESLAAAGAEQADFVQTYLPAGFSSGEEEGGRVALRLPDCLRWDYDEPFPKSFLLCGDRVWSWNPKDKRGQTGAVDRESQPGLDLLLLPVEQLNERYRATAAVGGGDDGNGQSGASKGRVTVHLEPLADLPESPVTVDLTEATLVVDTATERLVELSYKDREGNRTRFVLSHYRPLEDQTLFKAPQGITWEDQ